jgi:1-acyl-sn-glycerol-3-phosphate acyltransferase
MESVESGAAAGKPAVRERLPGRFYLWMRAFWRFAFFFTMRVKCRGLENLPSRGGVILAITHRSHLDPVVVSTLAEREIGWMARVEFYRQWHSRAFMNAIGAFPVDRVKPGVAPVREAIRRLRSSLVVGIFPEGEIQTGGARVTHGGPIKAGAVYLAALTGCPIVPVLVIGSEKLSSPWPWMPAKWGRLWVRFGEPVRVEAGARSRAGRGAAAKQLREQFQHLHREAVAEWNLPEGREK